MAEGIRTRFGEVTAETPWLHPDRILKRLWAKVDVRGPDECWLWTGATNGRDYGYGDIRIDGRNWRVHIVVYELLVGSIPSGLQIDHVCHNEAAARGACRGGPCSHRRCVNPRHLDVVTHQTNAKRGRNGRYLAERTHCVPHGHEYTPENTIIDKRGYRHCRECKRIEGRGYMRRKRAGVVGGRSA